MITKKQTRLLSSQKISLVFPLGIVIMLLLWSFNITIISQIPDTNQIIAIFNRNVMFIDQNPQDTTVYNQVDEYPEYPGGKSNLSTFYKNNVKYPDECKEKGVEGIVVVLFIIEKDGSVSNPKIIKSLNPLLDNELLRVTKLLPRFKPGKLKGSTVRVNMVIPYEFKL